MTKEGHRAFMKAFFFDDVLLNYSGFLCLVEYF